MAKKQRQKSFAEQLMGAFKNPNREAVAEANRKAKPGTGTLGGNIGLDKAKPPKDKRSKKRK